MQDLVRKGGGYKDMPVALVENRKEALREGVELPDESMWLPDLVDMMVQARENEVEPYHLDVDAPKVPSPPPVPSLSALHFDDLPVSHHTLMISRHPCLPCLLRISHSLSPPPFQWSLPASSPPVTGLYLVVVVIVVVVNAASCDPSGNRSLSGPLKLQSVPSQHLQETCEARGCFWPRGLACQPHTTGRAV